MAKINILALGGLDEKQKRLYVLEIDSKIFILDSGVYEPLNSDFGIKHFIPNTEYLKENRDKIKALFLSSANKMNIGSIGQIINIKNDIEIYGSKTTIDSLDVFFGEESKDWKKIKFEKMETKKIAGIDVRGIQMSSIIPGALGYQFKTEDGNILYLTDYIFDSIKEYNIMPINGVVDLLKEKNLLLISDVSKVEEKSSISSRFRIYDLIKKQFTKEKRLVVALYEDEIINVVELIKLSRENKKKIFIKSETLFNLLKIMMDNGDFEEFPIRLYKDFRKEDGKNSVIILSATRTKLYREIEIMIDANNAEDFSFEKDDIVFMSALPQPGNEHVFANVSNKITRINPIVIKPNSNEKTLFGTTGFDVRNYLLLLNPEHFMPVSSYYTQLSVAKDLAIQNNVSEKKIIIGDNGEKFSIENGSYKGMVQKGIESCSLVLDNLGNDSLTNELIEERKILGKNGVVSISFVYDEKKFLISSDIDIQMKGLVISKGKEDVINKIKDLIIDSSNTLSENKNHINKGLPSIKKESSKIFRENFKKVPTVIFNIINK